LFKEGDRLVLPGLKCDGGKTFLWETFWGQKFSLIVVIFIHCNLLLFGGLFGSLNYRCRTTTLTKRYIYCPGYDEYKHVQEGALGPLLRGDDGEGDGLDERLVLVP